MQPISEPHKQRQGRKKYEEDPPHQVLGRSRGGLTTKIHLICDAMGHPLAVDLLPGNQAESTQAERLLSKVRIPTRRGRPRNRPKYLVADKSYDVSRIRSYLRKRGIKAAIPNKAIPKGRKRRKWSYPDCEGSRASEACPCSGSHSRRN